MGKESKGERIESFVEYYDNERLKKKGTYKNRRLHGPYIEYYSSGETKEKGVFDDGFKVGEYLEYFPNGQLHKVITYEKPYHSELLIRKKKNPPDIEPFSYDTKSGPYKIFFENGNIKEKGIHEGMEHEYKKYYKNGNFKKVGFIASGEYEEYKEYFKDGLLFKHYVSQGETKEYYQNGQLKKLEVYDYFDKVGEFEIYYESGQIKEKGTYDIYSPVGSVLSGAYVGFYENGQVKVRGSYKNGRKSGIVEKFYEDGQLRERGNYIFKKYSIALGVGNYLGYDDGDLVEFSRKNNEIMGRYQDHKDGIFESYYQNGLLEKRISYRQGQKNGSYIHFNKNGAILKKGVFLNGRFTSQV